MKFLLVALLALSVVYCANKENLCTEAERNAQACTYDYNPVCAIQKTNNGYKRVTQPNRCAACSDKATDFIVQGECEIYPKEAAFCDPRKSENWMCTLIYKPVCGFFDSSIQYFAPPCAQTYSNGCVACTNSNVSYTIPGKCPNINA